MDADELVRRRTSLGISRGALAKEIGVAPSTVWRWEERGVSPIVAVDRLLEQTLQRLERNQRRRARAAGGREGEG